MLVCSTKNYDEVHWEWKEGLDIYKFIFKKKHF